MIDTSIRNFAAGPVSRAGPLAGAGGPFYRQRSAVFLAHRTPPVGAKSILSRFGRGAGVVPIVRRPAGPDLNALQLGKFVRWAPSAAGRGRGDPAVAGRPLPGLCACRTDRRSGPALGLPLASAPSAGQPCAIEGDAPSAARRTVSRGTPTFRAISRLVRSEFTVLAFSRSVGLQKFYH